MVHHDNVSHFLVLIWRVVHCGEELGMAVTVAILGFKKYLHADVVLLNDFVISLGLP